MQRELKLLKLRAIWNWHATLSELIIIQGRNQWKGFVSPKDFPDYVPVIISSGAPPHILDRQNRRAAHSCVLFCRI